MAGEEEKAEKRTPGPVQSPAGLLPGTTVPPVPVSPPVAPASDSVIEVTDQSWEKTVERGERPVAVMFYSPTCAFCHQMEPYFRSYAREYRNSVLFTRLNILTSQWTAERYGVRSTPTFTFFCNGKPVLGIAGAVLPALLKKMVDDVIIHGSECAKNSTEIKYEITGYG